MPPRDRLWIGLAAAVSHWALIATVQAVCFGAYLRPPSRWSCFQVLPFLHAQPVLVAAALFAIAWLLAAWRRLRWAILPFDVALAAFVLADQLFYKISFDHLRPSLYEPGRATGLDIALGSLTTQMDGAFWISAAVALAGAVWLAATLVRAPARHAPVRAVAAAGAALLLAGIVGSSSTRSFHLDEHPVVATLRDALHGSLSAALRGRKAAPPIVPGPVDHDPALAALAETGHKRTKRPNIVIVIMESVGAVDLFSAAGRPSPVYAPTLADLAERSVLFRAVYPPFPASTRAAVALHTGGRAPTDTSVAALEHRYQGPMLGRTLAGLGYATSYFSSESLNIENFDAFLEQAGYDRLQDFNRDPASRNAANRIHSWGAREEYTLGLIDGWLDEVRTSGKPFLLEYLTAATHHPYGTPPGYAAPFPPVDPLSQYRNAIHYTDHAIGALLNSLRVRGLADDTIVAVLGDHGEAFGEHFLNYLHKSFLYEENIRSFLLLFDPRWKLAETVYPARTGALGDIMPTLLSYIGAPDPTLAGRDLLAADFEARPVFFYKLAMPEQWGLRDGNWKFIAEIRTGKAELYDLAADPHELRDISAAHQDLVERYAALCADWFVRSDAEYTARVADYRPVGGRALRPEDYRTPGPKAQAVVMRENGRFTETTQLPSSGLPIVWNAWVPTGNVERARWKWTSPSGAEYWNDVDVQADWTYSYVRYPGPRPLERGAWKVQLWWNGQPGSVTQFQIQ